jgi:hypothetical protein
MSLGAFTDAPARAALPRLAGRDGLPRANAILGISWSATFLAGVALGGVVTATAGVAAAFAIDAATFAIAAALYATLPPLPPRRTQRAPQVWHPAAFAKVPTSLATGAAWILLHVAAAGAAAPALSIGSAHAARALGAGVVPVLWPRRLRASRLGIVVSTALAVAGAAAFLLAGSPVLALACAVIWGAGIGANWVTATTRLQIAVPDAGLGRASALDATSQNLAQCAGGLIALLLMAGCSSAPPRAPQAAVSVDERLAALAVTDDDFYRPVLYTWTTGEQIDALRDSHELLVATASTGGFTSPYLRALARTTARHGRGRAVARLLIHHPALQRRRYAWPSPFATVMGLGDRTYGTSLVRIELRPEAWIGRYDPVAFEPFSFVDASGAPVPLDDVLAEPERIGAIFHVRTDRAAGYHFREYVVCSEAMIASWSIATPQIRTEVDLEIDLLRDLREAIATLPRERWRRALAFENPKYEPVAARLDAIVAELARYDGDGEPLVVQP